MLAVHLAVIRTYEEMKKLKKQKQYSGQKTNSKCGPVGLGTVFRADLIRAYRPLKGLSRFSCIAFYTVASSRRATQCFAIELSLCLIQEMLWESLSEKGADVNRLSFLYSANAQRRE